MLKRLLVVAMLAATFSGPTFAAAEAGRLRDKVKTAVELGRGGAKAAALMTRCALKGKRGQIVC